MSDDGSLDHGPFHEGEVEAQRRAGESAQAERNSPMIGTRIMAGALDFVRQQPMAVIGSRDPGGKLWSSILFGTPGFLGPSPDRRSLRIAINATLQDSNDPLWRNLIHERQLGILVIELATRRRLRINGNVAVNTPDLLVIEVAESFANCPKYIQRRELQVSADIEGPSVPPVPDQTSQLSLEDSHLIQNADTLFVTSAHPERGLDASHRGGNPGFVEVLDEQTLRIPDYPGNSMFNTIGNFLTDPHAGLTIPDFEHHRLLQLSGNAEVIWERADGTDGNTGRWWIFHVDEVRRAPIPAAVRSHFLDYSPFNPATH
jgi:predicted pyridoxine 5'-phosphate oxidase superfamily flavin-nucleotide-binding protein